MTNVTVSKGESPLVFGQPHSGLFIPPEIESRLNEAGRAKLDTDWHVDRLYDGLIDDVTVVKAEFHRYVIDANRDPSGKSLYPGQNTTGLTPLVTFDDEPIWADAPTAEEIEARRKTYHAAYHNALSDEIERIKSLHGFAILYDCHSIRSHLPFLFEGRLPDLNIGDNNGATCAAEITNAVESVCRAQDQYSYVVNGRFRGGWTTRHYGKPDKNVHAIQMEIAQHCYLESETPPFAYSNDKAAALRIVLKNILEAAIDAAKRLY
ncbi:N-formylglutamate deformylase [Hyphococcus flavus]|uniref:N-formylglutamate deformylase n=1 Tax=Hyphococcus flavus TaxID=1866326 RepID=A0AAF0CET4_9PROT|nr:N-formylglutamate deformylase [Hyphococcus flavus]WDI30689.1 N-formylglutamate deformylase [Hyphococcus flavus]